MTLPTSIVARPSINISHQRIHEGNHFTIHKVTAGVVAPKYFLIIPPPPMVVGEIVEMHLAFQVYSDIGATLQFFEDPIITSNGTKPVTVINNNRRSSTTSAVNVFEDPTVAIGGDGTLLFEERIGTITTNDVIIGEIERDEEEFILDPASVYILKYIPLTPLPPGGANITMELNWYDNRPSSPVPIP